MADLQSTFEYLGLNGFLLAPAEQTALQCSLRRLSQEHGCHVKFWGKVQCLGKNDYLIAQGCRVLGGETCPLDELGNRLSWFSNDGGNRWTQLNSDGPQYVTPKGEKRPAYMDDADALRAESHARCEEIRGHFFGDPDFEYKVKEVMPEPEPEPEVPPPPKEQGAEGEDKEEEDEGEKEDEEEKAPEEEAEAAEGGDAGEGEGDGEGGEGGAEKKKKKKKYMLVATKESTRLAHFVKQHDLNCQVVPHGMLMLTAADPTVTLSVAINKTWDGLTPSAADSLENYLHLRAPSSSEGLPAKSKAHYNAVLDFMESIQNDIPSGAWSLQYDPALGVAIGKNLLYQGSVFYHRPGSATFGQYYFGNGQRNLDLCFMLPEPCMRRS